MAKKKKKKYIAAKNSWLTDKDADIFGRRIEKLKDKSGIIDPKTLVNDAQSPKSPLHKAFDWDDTSAAEKYRLQQARQLISAVEVIIESSEKDQETRTVRAFYHVTEEGHDRSYVSLESVQGNVDYRNQVINDALQKLTLWRERYQQYKEFAPIVEAIDKVVEKQK